VDAVYADKPLSPEVLRPLTERSDGPGLIRFALHYGLFLASSAGVVLVEPAWLKVVLGVVSAPLWMGLFAAAHETVHATAFRSRWLNYVVAWLVGFPMLFIPTAFREFHFHHHRHTHEEGEDPELPMPGHATGPSLPLYLGQASGVAILSVRVLIVVAFALLPASIIAAKVPWMRERYARRAGWECFVALLLLGGVGYAGWRYVPDLVWLLVPVFVSYAMLSTYLFCEHLGLEPRGSIFERTRSFGGNRLLNWIMWNMPWHAEHHAYPAVPFFRLGELHEALKDDLIHDDKSFLQLELDTLKRAVTGRIVKQGAPE
jgi:fatty acid desaturase